MNEYIKRENVMQTLQKANIGGYITERLLEIPSEDVQPVNQWISVKDRLPEDNRPVLCFVIDTTGEGRTYVIGSCEHSEFWFLKIGDNKRFSFPHMQIKVTHWQPLPESPKDGDTNE